MAQPPSRIASKKTAVVARMKASAPSRSSLLGIPLKLRTIVALLGQATEAKQLRRVGLDPPENGHTGIARSKADGLTARMSAHRLTEVRLTPEYRLFARIESHAAFVFDCAQ